MSVYVDASAWRYGRLICCHMIALQFKSPLVFCWGRCGGWGMREQDTQEVPCDVPGCLREHGHDAPHNPRVWEGGEMRAKAERRKR